MGNCGVGIAPCKPRERDVPSWDVVNMQAIPYDALSKGIAWEWETFPDFMAAAERRGVGINLAFLAPLTPFRHYVLGDESMERAAEPREIEQVAGLLREAMTAGAFGFSTTTLRHHIGYRDKPLACRLASHEELKAYANVLRDLGRGAIEIALTRNTGRVSEDEQALLEFLLDESQRPVTWLGIASRPDQPDASMDTLHRLERLIERGGIPQVLCKPLVVQMNLRNPFTFADIEMWEPLFGRPEAEQKKIYRDAKFRAAFREELKRPHLFQGKWNRVEVLEVTRPALKSCEGKSITEIAYEWHQDPLDTFFDLALEDDLKAQYTMQQYHEEGIKQLICDSRTMIGLSDGGAHVNTLCDAGYCTYLLGTWVRERRAMTLEQAVKRITSEPADFFGIKDRGRLKVGLPADMAIFNEARVGSATRARMQNDLPGGGRRLVMPAIGIEYTIVNGDVLFQQGHHTGYLPGRVLRSSAL